MTFSPEAAVARRSLLDALEALRAQLDALVLVGAQAVYLHTGDSDVAIASHTVDADLAVVPERLHDIPHLEDAMRSAGFVNDLTVHQPGAWISHDGVPVERLVPKHLHAGGGRRGACIPPHSKRAARSAPGLEAAAVDHAPHTIATKPTASTPRTPTTSSACFRRPILSSSRAPAHPRQKRAQPSRHDTHPELDANALRRA